MLCVQCNVWQQHLSMLHILFHALTLEVCLLSCSEVASRGTGSRLVEGLQEGEGSGQQV